MSNLGLFEGLKGEMLGDLVSKENKETAKNNNEKKENKKVTVDKTRIVCYAGHKIYIEDRKLSLEDIRKQLEKEFPELTRKRTTMEYDEKTGIIVPIIKAKTNGNLNIKGFYTSLTKMAENPRPINIVMGRDGLYEIRETSFGIFCVKKESVEDLEEIKERFLPKFPKIPLHLLKQIVSFFTYWADMGVEAEVQIFFDEKEHKYFVYVPNQKVSSFEVELERNLELENRYILAAEIHSHHHMAPVFSSIDNEEEKRTGIYGVIGNLNKKPDISMRYSCGGEYRKLNPEEVFENYSREELEKTVSYPLDWNKKIFTGGWI